jgi:hypothetical protein
MKSIDFRQGIEIIQKRRTGRFYLKTYFPLIVTANFPWEIALLIGNIASLFSNLDSGRAQYFNKIRAVNQYLR